MALTVAAAQSAVYDQVTINLNDGGKVEIRLGDELRMHFTDTDLIVSGTGSDVTVARENIKDLRHSKSSGISETVAADGFRYADGSLEFNDLPAGTQVIVCDTAGKVMRTIEASGHCVVSLSDLPKGVYVVKAGASSFKILIK